MEFSVSIGIRQSLIYDCGPFHQSYWGCNQVIRFLNYLYDLHNELVAFKNSSRLIENGTPTYLLIENIEPIPEKAGPPQWSEDVICNSRFCKIKVYTYMCEIYNLCTLMKILRCIFWKRIIHSVTWLFQLNMSFICDLACCKKGWKALSICEHARVVLLYMQNPLSCCHSLLRHNVPTQI